MPRRFSFKPLQWSARDATGKQVALYPGIYSGLGKAALRDGLTKPEIERVRNLCARDFKSTWVFWVCLSCGALLGLMREFLSVTQAVRIALPVVIAGLWAVAFVYLSPFRPGRSTFILAMLDINRCPSCAYTLPRSAKSPEPVQCSECGSHWRYALD